MAALDNYFAAVAAIRAEGMSSGGWVRVTRTPDGDISVGVRPGFLRRCSIDTIEAEIRSAIHAALADHRQQYRQLRIDYFGSPLGAEPFTPPIPEPEEHHS